MNERVRFYIDSSLFEDIRGKIDRSDILGLANNGSANTSRIKLVLFASAVGMHLTKKGRGEPKPLNSAKDFVRGENIVMESESQILSVAFDQFRQINRDEAISDDASAVSLLEEYANTGLREILSWVENMPDYGPDSREAILFEQMNELDEMYQECFPEDS